MGDEVQGWVEPEVTGDLEELGELLRVPERARLIGSTFEGVVLDVRG